MKTLIINNHTKHIDELRNLFIGADIIDKIDLVNHGTSDFENYDLIVLSGGSGNIPSVFHNPEEYQFEIDLVKYSSVPIVGICLGAEIIAHG